MFSTTFRPFSVLALLLTLYISVTAQSSPGQKPKPNATPPITREPQKPEEPRDIETLKTDTDLVTVPVVVTNENGTYVADLRQEEFKLAEDGVDQQIAFFATVSAPFHVVLMLDTSASTQEKLRLIQQAAYAFVEQLQPADRVKVISFDDEVRDRNEFTSNREILKTAIYAARSGQGTKVYDAIDLALSSLRHINGRKAIVIFTDGVDWHSDNSTFNSTVRWLDEEGVIVYPIRYDTRAATERLAREQAEETTPSLPTIDVIRRPPSGTTAPTFPSDDPDSVPTRGSQPTTGPLGLPLPAEILRRKRESDRNRDPNDRLPTDTLPDPSRDSSRLPPPPTTSGRRSTRSEDSISSMLDLAYSTADSYLKTLAEKTGGRLLRADTLASLPDAFAQIAGELRTQYVLGYYPLNKQRDEQYRKIAVTSTRKHVKIRARPGYLATNAR